MLARTDISLARGHASATPPAAPAQAMNPGRMENCSLVDHCVLMLRLLLLLSIHGRQKILMTASNAMTLVTMKKTSEHDAPLTLACVCGELGYWYFCYESEQSPCERRLLFSTWRLMRQF